MTVEDLDAGAVGRPDRGVCNPIELDAMAFDKSGCARYMLLPCGLPPDSPLEQCAPDFATCMDWCESSFRCQVLLDVSCRPNEGGLVADADVIFECMQCATGGGRRPRGLRGSSGRPSASALGTYFSELACLESASVAAFDDLARTLATLGAPSTLRHAARRARTDERRHAAITRRLARRFGTRPRQPIIVRAASPTLENALVDNAVEGCIGESYGAIVAMWQAARANDGEIARAMRAIATDETEHASLSWELLRWGAPRLDPAARSRLRARVVSALAELRERAEVDVDPSLIEVAGHPPGEIARVLVARFANFALAEADRMLGAQAAAGTP